MSTPIQSGFMMLRKPMPVARSIHWVPAGSMSTGVATGADVPLFITQGALREAMRHLRSDPEQELMGFLLGNLFECPDTGSRYVVITSALRTGHVIGEVEPVQIPEEEWLGMQLELRRRRAGLMGWYHSAPFVGSSPARLDLETQRERFHESWQSGLVIATTGPEPTGGFFRLTPGAGLNGTLIPFDEIADDDALLPGGRKRTLIDWANYRTEQPVEDDRSERRPHIAPARRSMPDPTDPAMAMPGQAPLPVMLPDPSEFDEDLPPMYPPPARRMRLGALAMVLLGAGALAAGIWWWNHRGGVEQPAGLGGLLPVPAATAPGAGEQLRDTSVYTPPRDTTGAGLSTGGSMAAVPPAAAAPNSTAVAKPGAGGAPSGGAAPPGGGAPSGGTMTAPPVARPAAPAPNAATGPAPAAAPPASDAKLLRFDALADSLDQAVRNFQDRDADFTMKRLTCRGLGVGYQAADDAYISLAASYRDVHSRLDGVREARFRTLSSQVDDVNTKFDATKCPRP